MDLRPTATKKVGLVHKTDCCYAQLVGAWLHREGHRIVIEKQPGQVWMEIATEAFC